MLTATLEKLLNRGLPRSPRARELCAQLAGRSLGIELRDLARLRLTSNGATLELAFSDAPADATLERRTLRAPRPVAAGLTPGRICRAAPSPWAGTPNSRSASGSCCSSCDRMRRRSCRASSAMSPRTASQAWRAAGWT